MPFIIEVNPPWNAVEGDPGAESWVPVFDAISIPVASVRDTEEEAIAILRAIEVSVAFGFSPSVGGPRNLRVRDTAQALVSPETARTVR